MFQRRQHQKVKAEPTEPSFSTVIDSYNQTVKSNNNDELLPKVRLTTHHPRYKKSSSVKHYLSRSEDPLIPETSQVHHTMYMQRRPKSASPHGNKRRVILEHTNITEIVYDSSENLKGND